jgi:hypothetical protein
MGGAYDRPTRGCWLLWRAKKALGSDFDSALHYAEADK